MAQSREVEYWDRFDGGLNLNRQTQSLDQTETPDALNIDYSMRGGFMLRGGFQTQETDALLSGARFLGEAYVGSDLLLLHSSSGDLLTWDGSTLTDTTYNVTDEDTRVRMAAYNDGTDDVAYFSNGRSSGSIVMYKYDGTTLSSLGSSFDDDYVTPSGANMPSARFIASHNGFVFVADTVESGTRYPARLRWSHLRVPESWATADYVEVGTATEGDPITGLMPFGSMLLIFKKSEVWALYGQDRERFILERISSNSGTCTCGAITKNAGVAYWFSTDGQLMAYDGRKPVPLSQNIDWWSQIGKIKHGGAHRLMWHDGRVWCSLEAGVAEDVDRWLFIWDPGMKAWSRYDRQVSDLYSWMKIGEDADPLFLQPSDTNLYRYDRAYSVDTDETGNVRIDGYFRTAWFRAGETATKKRWKRPRVTAAAESDATIVMESFRDFNDATPVAQQEFLIETPDGTSVWGSFDWGDNWQADGEEFYEFARLPSTGSARAVSYKFSSPDNGGRWWVDSLAIPYRRKQVR